MRKEIYLTFWTKEGKQELTRDKWLDFVESKPHRLDGPAVEYTDGRKQWWIDGNWLVFEKVETWIKENNVDLKEPEGQMAFKLRWS